MHLSCIAHLQPRIGFVLRRPPYLGKQFAGRHWAAASALASYVPFLITSLASPRWDLERWPSNPSNPLRSCQRSRPLISLVISPSFLAGTGVQCTAGIDKCIKKHSHMQHHATSCNRQNTTCWSPRSWLAECVFEQLGRCPPHTCSGHHATDLASSLAKHKFHLIYLKKRVCLAQCRNQSTFKTLFTLQLGSFF